jgi:hypothetical protein
MNCLSSIFVLGGLKSDPTTCDRHILIDTMGLILMVVVHTASIQDRDGAKLVFDKICNSFPKLHLIWADA